MFLMYFWICHTDVLKRWGCFHILLCSLSNVRASYFKSLCFACKTNFDQGVFATLDAFMKQKHQA